MIRVSILLPAWNAAATLGTALESVRRQSLREWECVIVDDGSTDGTLEVAARYATADSRIRVVHTPHRGLVSALNAGLRHCCAPLVARMDADDVMHRERLAAQVEALERDSSLAGVGCHVRLFPRASLSPRRREYEAWLNGMRSADDVACNAYVECPVAHPTLVLRRDIIERGYADNGWPEDYDLVLAALTAGLRIGIVPRRLLAWRDHPRRASRVDPRYGLDRFVACKAHHLARSFLAGSASYVLWGYGATGRQLRRALARHGRHPSHVLDVKRSRIGQRIHGAPVLSLDALPKLRGLPIVVSVARQGPRQQIRTMLADAGFVERRDYVCAA